MASELKETTDLRVRNVSYSWHSFQGADLLGEFS